MPDTRRQQLFDAVLAALATITVANGYNRNLGEHLFAWRDPVTEPFQENELPGGFVRDPQDTAEHSNYSRYDRTLSVEIGLATIAAPVDRELRLHIADVSKCVMANRRWGGLAEDTNLVSDEMGITKAEKNTGNAVVNINIRYRVMDTDPYTK